MPATTTSTRDQILDAAERLFARKGFDPTTIKEIGAAAKLNPALLYYYFRDKEELYRAVLQRVAGELVTRGRAGLDAARPPSWRFARWSLPRSSSFWATPTRPSSWCAR